MIKLGYLDDYNSYNVPSFANESERNSYFDNIATFFIDAYYPPFYTNLIKLYTTEVPLNSQINFVILVFENKYYYYFIDKIIYKNEDIYEIKISMDTALTYMFDFKVTNGIITRKSINRWNGNNINRNYIRENLSEGFMDIEEYDLKSPNKYVIVCSSQFYRDNVTPFYTNITKGYNIFNPPYYIYIIPLPPENLISSGANVYVSSNVITNILCRFNDLLFNLFSDPHTLNMYYIESEFLDNLLNPTWEYVSSSSLRLTLDYDLYEDNIMNMLGGNSRTLAFNLNEINIDYITSSTILFDFEKNTNLNVNFNIKYIPQLLDENYIQIEYGDVTSFSAYPLHLANTPTLYAKTSMDIVSGNIVYYITDSINDDNRYKTAVVSMPVTFELITDAWQDYQARNKASLTTGLQLQFVNTMYSTVKGMSMSKASQLFYNTRSLQYFEKDMQGASDLYANKSYGEQQKQTGFLADGLMNGMNIIANYKINKENLEFTPDIIRGNSEVYTNFIDGYKNPYIKKYYVSDIVACGKKLEEYGYKVNEVYNTSSFINQISNIRHYYNCLSINILSFETLVIIPYEHINDIIERLKNGLRFINMNSVTTKISDIFKYDNKEE